MSGAWFPHGETIRVFTQTGYDRFGDYTYDAGRLVHGCAATPRSSREDSDRRDTIFHGLQLYAPYDAGITATDIIQFQGQTQRWHVDGEPAVWRDPFTGWAAGLEIALTRVDG